jgi:hypothetical protein
MKNSQLTSILMGLTAVSAAASIVLCGLMISRSRELRQYQYQSAAIQQNRIVATALVNDLTDYSKRDPQIKPLLQKVMQPQAAPAPAQPAAR